MQKVVLVTTFALTMLIPLQCAVLVGVGLSVILHVVRQSNQVTIKRRQVDPEGQFMETDPPVRLPAEEVVILQPYGSLFFAAARGNLRVGLAECRLRDRHRLSSLLVGWFGLLVLGIGWRCARFVG